MIQLHLKIPNNYQNMSPKVIAILNHK